MDTPIEELLEIFWKENLSFIDECRNDLKEYKNIYIKENKDAIKQ
jgi:hypothetical protein